MVRYSDIIKYGNKKKEDSGAKTPVVFEGVKKINDSFRFSSLKESMDESRAESRPEPRVESVVESKPEPRVESMVESQAEPKAESMVESQAEPKAESKVEPKVEPKVKPKAPSALSSIPAEKDTGNMKELRSIIANYLNGVRDQIKNDKPIHIKQAVDIITHFIDTPDLIEKFYQLTAMSHNNGDKDYLIRHLINVMICSIKIGTHLGYPREELIELGLAALLYDVGLFKIPESITGKIGKLTNTELGIIKKHTSIGRDILSPFRDEHPIPCRAAYEHHERENGNGYPEGLKGNEICKCAKIIGLVDTFDAMIRNRPHRKALMQYLSIKELIASKNSPFAPEIVKVFLNEISVFPVGSYVKLNNMSIGEVIAINKTYSLKPTINLIVDGNGKKVSGNVVIDLEKQPVLYILNAVSEDDIPS